MLPAAINRQYLIRCASLALALFVLNFVLTFHNLWPTPFITTRNELSVEIALLLLSLALYARWVAPVPTRLLTPLALILTVMSLFRYIEVTAPALFGRAVNLYWDAQYLPHVAEMLAEAATPLLVFLVYAGFAFILIVIFFAIRYSLARVVTAFSGTRERTVITLLMAIVTLGYFMGHVNQPLMTLKYYSLPLTRTYWGQVEFIASALGNDAIQAVPAGDPLTSYNLLALGNSDVIVQFIESYGASAYDNPAIAGIVAPSQAQFAESVAASGRRVISAFITSPTFGGNSWLSHSSFMTGLNIDHLSVYNLLLTRQRRTLSNVFADNGYRPIALMPGLRTDWPEGAFYGFETIYGATEIDYQGPEFGWWRIPDQYSLAKLHALEIEKPAREPLFLLFTTISSHMPFRPTPPYQADWSRLLQEEPYDTDAVARSLALLPDWSNLQPSYAGTLAYNFTYMGGYLQHNADDDFFWILIGDHQPPAAVSGPDVRWDVPVHIVSDNDSLLDELISLGFTEGMVPGAEPVTSMATFPVELLSVFSR